MTDWCAGVHGVDAAARLRGWGRPGAGGGEDEAEAVRGLGIRPAHGHPHQVGTRASNDPLVSLLVFTIMEKVPSRAFSWLKAATTTFTFKTLC